MTEPSKQPESEETRSGAEPADEQAAQESTEETSEETTAHEAPDGDGTVPESAPEPDPLAVLQEERDAIHEKWLRTVAELDNVRKRAARDVTQARRFAQADVLRAFLEVMDNFERALQTAADDTDTGGTDAFREGVELIHQKLRTVFRDQGVTAMEVLGQAFDPNVHEAVAQLEREGVESGVVIEVVQTGYHFGDMVLRPARVVIST